MIAVAYILPRVVGPGSEPARGGLEVSAETRDYLSQVEAICRAHDREVSTAGLVPIAQIVRSEAGVTSRIASVEAPAEAREIRHRLLAARRRVDRTTVWVYRVLSRSEDPPRHYREKLKPVVRRRSRQMYQTFGSYGVRCNTESG